MEPLCQAGTKSAGEDDNVYIFKTVGSHLFYTCKILKILEVAINVVTDHFITFDKFDDPIIKGMNRFKSSCL